MRFLFSNASAPPRAVPCRKEKKFAPPRTKKKNRNFKRPFTPWTWLRSARNFGKTRFRWFATFDFSTLNNKFLRFLFGDQFCFQKTGVSEELDGFKGHGQVVCEKLLPVVRLFLGRVPWRRGKRLNMCRNPRLGTENDFNNLVLWCYDDMIVW